MNSVESINNEIKMLVINKNKLEDELLATNEAISQLVVLRNAIKPEVPSVTWP